MPITYNFFQIAVLLIGLPFMAFGAYFFIVALFSFKKSRNFVDKAPKTRFAVVIAARNEESVIGKLVESLKAQEYPSDLYEIIVAPNNCTDNTEAMAKAHGARIFNHKGVVRSKGEVLTQVVDEIVLRESFDAMCVFDADCLADPDFLHKMNNSVLSGANAVQGFRDSKNPRGSTVSGWYAICYWMLNRFYNQPRRALGLSALVSGNGFAITTELLRRLGGWHTVTMTEDYEISAKIALLGQRVHFAPDACVYNDLPDTFKVSWKQRRRWVSGCLEGLQIYAMPLLKNAVEKQSAVSFDMCLTFLSPVVGLLSMIVGLISSTMFGFVPMLFMIGASLIMSVMGAAAAAFITAKLRGCSARKMVKAIVSFSMFLASQMAITVSCLFKLQKTWDVIEHNHSIDSEYLKTKI